MQDLALGDQVGAGAGGLLDRRVRVDAVLKSEEFRARWATHNVRFHDSGVKQVNHPIVGELDLVFNRLELPGDHGLTILTYVAEPGSRSEEALKLLGSWAVTPA